MKTADPRRASGSGLRFRVFDGVVRDQELTRTAIKVAWRIVDRMNKEDEAWPSAETIATEIGASVNVAKRNRRT